MRTKYHAAEKITGVMAKVQELAGVIAEAQEIAATRAAALEIAPYLDTAQVFAEWAYWNDRGLSFHLTYAQEFAGFLTTVRSLEAARGTAQHLMGAVSVSEGLVREIICDIEEELKATRAAAEERGHSLYGSRSYQFALHMNDPSELDFTN